MADNPSRFGTMTFQGPDGSLQEIDLGNEPADSPKVKGLTALFLQNGFKVVPNLSPTTTPVAPEAGLMESLQARPWETARETATSGLASGLNAVLSASLLNPQNPETQKTLSHISDVTSRMIIPQTKEQLAKQGLMLAAGPIGRLASPLTMGAAATPAAIAERAGTMGTMLRAATPGAVDLAAGKVGPMTALETGLTLAAEGTAAGTEFALHRKWGPGNYAKLASEAVGDITTAVKNNLDLLQPAFTDGADLYQMFASRTFTGSLARQTLAHEGQAIDNAVVRAATEPKNYSRVTERVLPPNEPVGGYPGVPVTQPTTFSPGSNLTASQQGIPRTPLYTRLAQGETPEEALARLNPKTLVPTTGERIPVAQRTTVQGFQEPTQAGTPATVTSQPVEGTATGGSFDLSARPGLLIARQLHRQSIGKEGPFNPTSATIQEIQQSVKWMKDEAYQYGKAPREQTAVGANPRAIANLADSEYTQIVRDIDPELADRLKEFNRQYAATHLLYDELNHYSNPQLWKFTPKGGNPEAPGSAQLNIQELPKLGMVANEFMQHGTGDILQAALRGANPGGGPMVRNVTFRASTSPLEMGSGYLGVPLSVPYTIPAGTVPLQIPRGPVDAGLVQILHDVIGDTPPGEKKP